MKKLITVLHGFCMALADSVPGVSGGTDGVGGDDAVHGDDGNV
jgi:hypothetical protein